MLRVRNAGSWRRKTSPGRTRLYNVGRLVCRKYRNAYIHKLQQREYDKLRSMVPALQAASAASAVSTSKSRPGRQGTAPRRVSKVTVIEETIRYIDELHKALAQRVHAATAEAVAENGKPVTDESVINATKMSFINACSSRQKNVVDGSVRPSNSMHTDNLVVDSCQNPSSDFTPVSQVVFDSDNIHKQVRERESLLKDESLDAPSVVSLCDVTLHYHDVITKTVHDSNSDH